MNEYIERNLVLNVIANVEKEAPLSFTHAEIIDTIVEQINALPAEDVNELKKRITDLNNRRHLIWAIGVDYDGCNTVESLKSLIDELVSYTQLPSEEIPDITSRTGTWRLETDAEEANPMFKCVVCSACNKTANKPYKYCPECGAKMKEVVI